MCETAVEVGREWQLIFHFSPTTLTSIRFWNIIRAVTQLGSSKTELQRIIMTRSQDNTCITIVKYN